MRRTLLSATVATVFLLTSCGASEEETAKAEISEYLVKEQGEQEMFQLEKKEADCIAGDMVDGIGVDQLKEYKLLKDDGTVNANADVENLADEDAEVMADAMLQCADVMKEVKDGLAESMPQATPEVKKCFDEALTEDLVRKMLVATFTGKQDAAQELTAPLMECAMGAQPQE